MIAIAAGLIGQSLLIAREDLRFLFLGQFFHNSEVNEIMPAQTNLSNLQH